MSQEEKQRRRDEAERWIEERFQESVTPTAKEVVLPAHVLEELERYADALMGFLLDTFGGATQTPGKGYLKSKQRGEVDYEDVEVCYAYCDHEILLAHDISKFPKELRVRSFPKQRRLKRTV